ncbi:MAG: mRNA cleavage and polyadenylation factor subunit [Candelina mexicana]|nr:MAG: mRNA cleavage and polyadenylation factor subunit [Candelina mexicana]
MQCCAELTPPTAVTHSLSFPFLSPTASNLIVAKTSLLQVYSLKSVLTETGSTRLFRRDLDDSTTKLVLVAEYPLSGTVTALGSVKTLTSKSGGDCLLVAFKDAKLSLVEWDPERYGLFTVSIHYYEREDLQGSPWAVDSSQSYNYLTVDPSSRCAALKFGTRNLAILPFRQAGDDLVMDDYDPDLDGEPPEPTSTTKLTNGNTSSSQTPYSSSFVLPLSILDSSLIYPVHLSFLHEYREPTFGILSSSAAPSLSLLHERRDVLTYSVFTLDLEQRASTTLLSISGLPYDLYRLIPLPPPVGGALLLGGNELIHVDQSGKTNGVAVNAFAKQSSSFGMADQADLEMKLEGCTIEQLDAENCEMLMVLNTGDLAILSFKLDGRSVSGVSVRRVAEEHGGLAILAGASCASPLGSGRMFVGSEDTDSVVLGWTRKSSQLTRRRSELQAEFDEDMSDEDDEDYDDLYASTAQDNPKKSEAGLSVGKSQTGDYVFRLHDALINLAPMRDLAFARPKAPPATKEKSGPSEPIPEVELVTACGRSRGGGVAVMNRELSPRIQKRLELPKAQGVWSFHVQSLAQRLQPSQTAKRDTSSGSVPAHGAEQFDNYVIISNGLTDGGEESMIYILTTSGFEELKDTEFDPAAGGTVDVGTLARGTRVVQVLASEIRSYDSNLGIAQIYPMFEDYEGVPPSIVSASFADPYLLLFLSDSTINLLEVDDRGDIDEVEREGDLLVNKWVSGSLYTDHKGVFVSENGGRKKGESTLMFLIDTAGALKGNADGSSKIYDLSRLGTAAYTAETLTFLPPTLSAEYTVRRSTARENVAELLVADLGDAVSKAPYLILRSANDDITIYEPFHYPQDVTNPGLLSSLRFNKIPSSTIAKTPEYATQDVVGDKQEPRKSPLRAMSNVGGYSTVFLPNESSSFLMKSASSKPRILSLRGKGVRGMSSLHTAMCQRGWIYVDVEGIVRCSNLPDNVNLTETGWVMKRILLGEEVHALSYHLAMESYVIATSEKVDWKLPEDEEHHEEWRYEDLPLKPKVDESSIKILNPLTWTVVDSYGLEPTELVLCMKTLDLEVSEHTHARKELIAVGTAFIRGEDLLSRGMIYVFDVIYVVPEPSQPETNRKLKLIAKEEVKGAVTALSTIGTQGFLLAAQGQKCMVRGLKEDGSLLPVAFMDMMCYVSVAKELKGTGMCVMGDALKGVWFAGYSQDPYKMTLFGKSSSNLEVMTAEFLPDGKHLYIVAMDADCNMHVFQFDPEHPKSLSGHRLLHRSTYHTGHFPASLTLLPSSSPPPQNSPPNAMSLDFIAPTSSPTPASQLLFTTQTGSLHLLTPLSEPLYRRLSALQTQLTNTLEHACGLNPKAYRAVETDGMGGRGVIDGKLLARWFELGSWRRREVAGRVGIEGEEGVRSDLRAVSGEVGLGFL